MFAKLASTMKSIRVHSLPAIALITLLCQSCGDSASIAPIDLPILAKEPILPLLVGNRWTWLTSTYDTSGNLRSTKLDSLRIDSVKSADSQMWFFPSQPYEQLAFSNSVGGCYYRAFSDSVGSSFLCYKYPASVGDTYKAPQGIVSGNHVWIVDTLETMTVVSVDTAITVPAGTFRCYLYRRTWNRGPWYHDEFLSPSCGWIRIVTYTELPLRHGIYFRQYSQDLTQFVPGK